MPLPNVLVQGLGDCIFGTVPHKLLNDLPTLEYQQGRDSSHFVAHWCSAIGVDIHLADLDLVLILGCQFLDDGRNRAARTAPRCPEIHQNGLVRFQYILVEVRICYFDDSIACHFPSPRCNVALSADAPSEGVAALAIKL